MKIIKNICLFGAHNKPIVTDLFFNENERPKPIVIFAHGYKGYKDWGCWNLMAEAFAKENIFFIKFNFSHNGGTLEDPIDFSDLEAFGQNNYSLELADLNVVIDWAMDTTIFNKEKDLSQLILMGHSRGGGIVSLLASGDKRVSKLISLAAVSDFESRFPAGKKLEQWKKDGVYYVLNGRTKQEMPHYYQFYKDFLKHRGQLNIKTAVKNLKIPHLIIHGTGDTSVAFAEAENLHSWNRESTLVVIKDANHTFGSSQPWTKDKVPDDFSKFLSKVIAFCL